MHLINTRTLELEEFFGSSIPKYAILSHTWGKEEVTFQDWADRDLRVKKAGYKKMILARDQAVKDGLSYLWVDTNCIDKTSSAELSEAINSMFAWYKKSSACYAYLEDVHVAGKTFAESKWFTRGWTLQELLAPSAVHFYDRDWAYVESRRVLAPKISAVTSITEVELENPDSCEAASIATKMMWLSRRRTTRIEDMAYCMLGIFNINMPLMYGEGERAFVRLQEEIIQVSNDQTIFCWNWNKDVPRDWSSLLAPCPSVYSGTAGIYRQRTHTKKPVTYAMTNAGLHITFPLISTSDYCLAILDAYLEDSSIKSRGGDQQRIAIPVKGSISTGIMKRHWFPMEPINYSLNGLQLTPEMEHELYLPRKINMPSDRVYPPAPEKKLPEVAGTQRLLVVFHGFDFHQQDLGSRFQTFPPNAFNPTTSLFQLATKDDDDNNNNSSSCNNNNSLTQGSGWFLRVRTQDLVPDTQAGRLEFMVFVGARRAEGRQAEGDGQGEFFAHLMPSTMTGTTREGLEQELERVLAFGPERPTFPPGSDYGDEPKDIRRIVSVDLQTRTRPFPSDSDFGLLNVYYYGHVGKPKTLEMRV